MLTNLRIENYKLWTNTGDLRLAPLTVLFGTNSSGKTSLTQLLLLLRQTAESPDRRRVIHFGDRRSLVDVGTYSDLVHNHETDRDLSFSLGWDLPQPIKIQDTRTALNRTVQAMEFEASVGQAGQKRHLALRNFRYRLRTDADHELVFGIRSNLERPTEFDLVAEGFDAVRSKGRVWPLREPVRFYGFPDEVSVYYSNTGFLPDFQLELERQLTRIFYLGPIRDRPARSYVWSGEVPEHVGWQGERVIEAILSASERRISPGYKRHYVPFQEMVARWLQKLGLIRSFDVKPIGHGRKEYEALVQVEKNSPKVTLVDVGFGISQVLPVLVQCLYAPRHATLVFEQPEIHLHPKVQAGLADLFAEVLESREGGKDRNVQLVIESHSEHFLRRVQTLIAKDRLRPEDVAVYFCTSTSEGEGRIEELEVDLFGRIKNWPEHFFGDLVGEAEERTYYMLQRMTQVTEDG